MPCADERIDEDGHWDWERYGDTKPEISEITVSKVETYCLMRDYLSKLRNTPMQSLEDIVRFNDQNRGSEGGHAGDLPGFADGQDLFRKCVATKGVKDETYYAALHHIRRQCRQNGIDSALQHPHDEDETLDALLFCDMKMAGQCIAAQAGYPIISVPIGLDPDGMPVGLTLQHSAWEEARLVKWASAIEDSVRDRQGPRATPSYKDHLRKNVPVYYPWTYEGAPKFDSD